MEHQESHSICNVSDLQQIFNEEDEESMKQKQIEEFKEQH